MMTENRSSSLLTRKVIAATNLHQKAYYDQSRHPLNIWPYAQPPTKRITNEDIYN